MFVKFIALFGVSLGVCCVTAKEDGPFLKAASKYVNDKKGLIQLYADSQQDHENNKRSELDEILRDMINFSEENADEKRPKHVVTILADDMGIADIGYNEPTFITPTLDILAGHGVKFNNFYVQSTCSPTRASLLTGREVMKTGLQDGAIIPGESRFLPLSFRTTGNYFQDAGYSTNFIGKWHLGQRYMNETPTARGYDYFFGILGGTIDSYTKRIGLACGSAENNFTAVFGDDCLFLNAYDFQENGVPFIDTVSFASDILTDKAIARFDAHDKTKGLLLHYHTNAPHAPLVAPQQLIDNCAGVDQGGPDAVRPYFRQIVCAMVSSTDIDVLRMLFSLGLNGMLPNTLFQFSSDNGGLTMAGSTNLPYRAQKGATFEGGIRAASFLFGNGLHQAHRARPSRDDLMYVADVLPTLLGYAGIQTGSWLSNPFDGYNVWPLLTKNKDFPRSSVALVSASEYLGGFTAYIAKVQGATWKFLFNPSVLEFVSVSSFGANYQSEGEFLFNLSEDPYEANNLVANTDWYTKVVYNYLKARVYVMRYTAAPSQLTQFPPVIDLPCNDGGCWLPLDSPNFATAVCGVENIRGNFPIGGRFTALGDSVGASNEYNQYITADLNI